MPKLASPRRLPGISFEVKTPPLAESLPRMDIAVFVGFASSGPLHVPVAIEDTVHFTEIFGDDLPLAWVEEKGEQVYAYLAPAVRSFFRNGGRRCWVIRVADESTAKFNYFPITGLLSANFGNGNVKQIRPAFARARSQGSWSDSISVSAVLSREVLPLQSLSLREDLSIECFMSRNIRLSQGDLLSISFRGKGYVLMFYVKSLEPVKGAPVSSPPETNGLNVRIIPEKTFRFKTNFVESPPLIPEKACLFDHEKETSLTVLPQPLKQNGALISVYLSLKLKDAPLPGSMMRVDCGSEQLWLTVREAVAEVSVGSSPVDIVEVIGEGISLPQSCQAHPERSSPVMEKLTFELLVKEADKTVARLGGLGFAESHPRFWGALPTDQALFKDILTAKLSPHKDLLLEASAPRFPLAASDQLAAHYFPIGMQILPDNFLNAEKQIDDPMSRNGASVFTEDLFLDPGLKDLGTEQLITQSDFLRYQAQSEYKLKGIHAALNIEESTIIAVPDAIHRGWEPKPKPKELPVPEYSWTPFRPDWWHHLDCTLKEEEIKTQPEVFHADKPAWENFLNCDLRIIPPPELWKMECIQTNIYRLFWSSVEPAGYILQEATNPEWTDAADIYAGTESQLVIYGRGQGIYYYRVCAEVGDIRSAWSNEVSVNLSQSRQWQLDKVDKSSETLLAIHRALLQMCAARGDLFAVLALPEHYREDQSSNYIEKLKSQSFTGAFDVRAIGGVESSIFSYGAIYHPWVIGMVEDSAEFRSIPPDGAICGVMAKRALARGAWIAPANELMTGIAALSPDISEARRLELQQAQMNVLRQEPRGFVTLSADTLSDDPDLRPISVRRLLILLRRLALRLGAQYVFEPNDDAFRRMVKRGFEAMLDDMFVRGAFAGKTPGTAYQVVTSGSINTPQSIEQGRFIVELKVAPSLPMTFLTIRLVQTGDRLSVSEVR